MGIARFDSREETCPIQSRIQASRKARQTAAQPASLARTTAVLTVVPMAAQMVVPKARQMVARMASLARTTAALTVVPMAAQMVAPLNDQAARFELYQH
ncbi:cell division septum initiation protein DivIVA [Paenarthrobacter sp. TE4293]